MSQKDNNPIPASLRIGNMGNPMAQAPRGKANLLKGINADYADWLANQTEWIKDPNSIRDLIIRMKIVIDDMEEKHGYGNE